MPALPVGVTAPLIYVNPSPACRLFEDEETEYTPFTMSSHPSVGSSEAFHCMEGSTMSHSFLVNATEVGPSFDMAARPTGLAPFTAFPQTRVFCVGDGQAPPPSLPATSIDSGCDTSIGQRSRQEDTLIVRNDVKTWAVFDGHRGHEASSFAANFFVEHCGSEDPLYHGRIDAEDGTRRTAAAVVASSDTTPDGVSSVVAAGSSQWLADALHHLETSMHANNIGLASGTTACVAVVGPDDVLRIANIGDSRAVLASRNGAVRLVTSDHKVSSAQEVARFARDGFSLRNGRLSDLSVTRGLGDFDIKAKNRGLSSAADIYEVHAEAGDVLIIATDGVWDVVSTDEAVRVVLSQVQQSVSPGATPRNGPRCAAQALVAAALASRSGDNCTAVVVSFKW